MPLRNLYKYKQLCLHCCCCLYTCLSSFLYCTLLLSVYFLIPFYTDVVAIFLCIRWSCKWSQSVIFDYLLNINRNHTKRLLCTMSAKSKEFSIQLYTEYNITLLSRHKVLNTLGRCKQFLALLIIFLLGIFVIKMLLQQQQ